MTSVSHVGQTPALMLETMGPSSGKPTNEPSLTIRKPPGITTIPMRCVPNFPIWIHMEVSQHRDTPSHHPFLDGSLKQKPSSKKGDLHDELETTIESKWIQAIQAPPPSGSMVQVSSTIPKGRASCGNFCRSTARRPESWWDSVPGGVWYILRR